MKYEIKFNGKKYSYNGANCAEVMAKFANRKVFGNDLIFSYKLRMCDADTRGEIWAQYFTDKDDEVMIGIIKEDDGLLLYGDE